MEKPRNEPRSWATVQKGPFAERKGMVIESIPEVQDGIPVPGGLEYFRLQGDGIPENVVFRHDELQFLR